MTELFAWDAAGVPAALTGKDQRAYFISFRFISSPFVYLLDVCSLKSETLIFAVQSVVQIKLSSTLLVCPFLMIVSF